MNVDQKYIEHANNLLFDLPFIEFDKEDGTFLIKKDDLSYNEFKQTFKLVERLRWDEKFNFDCHRIRIDEFNTGYYDKCLEHYCQERLLEGKDHNQTCWVMNNEKTAVINKIKRVHHYPMA